MRILFIGLIILLTTSCTNKKEKDLSDLDRLTSVTDSLLSRLQLSFDEISKNLYFISDDSTKRDSIIQVLNLPDSLGFYQFIEKSLTELNEIAFQIQQEIYFAKDQLNSVRNEYLNNDISETEYLIEVTELLELVQFLEERVDSSLTFIDSEYYFQNTLTDSLQ